MKLVRRTTKAGVLCLGVMLALTSCVSTPEVKSARFIEAGKKLMKNKDAARAILQFQNAVKATPKNPEAYYQLGLAFLAASDLEHGIRAFQKTVELDPKHKGAQLELAKMMALVDDKTMLQDANDRLRAILQDNPNNPDALHSLALTELKLGDSSGAIRDLSLAMAAAPQEVMIASTLAQAKIEAGDVKGAEAVLRTAQGNAPKSVGAIVLMGRFYMGLKRLPEAEQEFKRALAVDPNDSSALFNLGAIQYQAGRKQEAEQTFKKLAHLPDKSEQASLAEFLFQEHRTDEAVAELERLWKEDSSDRLARTRLVVGYLAVNRSADAEKLLAQVLKKNPKDLDALLQRGEIFLKQNDLKKAEMDLNDVVHLQPAAPEIHYVLAKLYQARSEDLRYRQELTRALELNAYLIQVRLELAGSLMASKGGGQAGLDVLNGAPESQKNHPFIVAQRNWAFWALGDMANMRKGIDQGLAMQRSTEFLLQDGVWKLRSSNPSAARVSLEEALKVNPADVRALSALKESYEIQKQTAVALEKVKEYAAREPRSAPVQNFLGSMLLVKGDRSGARAAFQTAKASDPHSVLNDLSLTQVDLLDGKIDDAQHRLQGVLSVDPGNNTARLWLGNVEYTKGNYKAALEDFRSVVAADPNNPQALNNLAFMLAEYGNQASEALKYAQKAKELVPDSPEYSDTLGWTLYHQGLYASAINELERASKSGDATSEYHLAMAYAKAGDLKRGRAAFQAAQKSNPSLPIKKTAQDVIDAAAKSDGAR